MSKVFEDEFMEIQSEMVSLCLEYLEKERKKGKKIYIYCNNENNTMMFHAFFHIGDEIWSLGHRQFFKYDHLSDQVFDIGMELMRDQRLQALNLLMKTMLLHITSRMAELRHQRISPLKMKSQRGLQILFSVTVLPELMHL